MFHRIKIVLRIILLLVICAIYPISYSQTNANAQTSKRKQVRTLKQNDRGVDIGIVKVATSLFSEPSGNSTKIGTFRKGNLAVLVSRQKSNGWLNVVQFMSGHQGWVKAEKLILRYTNRRLKGKDFIGEASGTSEPPKIKVINASNKILYLHINAMPEISVAPNSTKTITLPAGLYTYNGASPNVYPVFGSMYFISGFIYTWTFTIDLPGRSKKRNMINPALIAESKQLQEDINKHTQELSIVKQQIDDSTTQLEQRRRDWKIDSDTIELKRQTLDRSDESVIAGFNQFVDTTNNKLIIIKEKAQQLEELIAAYNSNLNFLNEQRRRLEKIANTINIQR